MVTSSYIKILKASIILNFVHYYYTLSLIGTFIKLTYSTSFRPLFLITLCHGSLFPLIGAPYYYPSYPYKL